MKNYTNNQTEFNMRITARTKQSRVHWNSSKTKPNWKFNSKKKEKKITSLESRVEEADSGSILLRNPVKPPNTRNPNPKIYKLKGSRN